MNIVIRPDLQSVRKLHNICTNEPRGDIQFIGNITTKETLS
jgi:hypothetical protein